MSGKRLNIRAVDMRRTVACLALGCACSLLVPTLAPAAIPGVEDPKAYTEHDLRRDRLEFNRRHSVQRYLEAGQRDPKWDEPALKLLEGISKTMAYSHANWTYDVADKPKMDDLVQLGWKAIEAGCPDPLVRDFYAVALHDSGRKNQVQQTVAPAARALMKSCYSPYRAAASAARARDTFDAKSEPEMHQRFDQMFWDAAIAAMCDPNLGGRDPRIVLALVMDDFQRLPTARKKETFEKADAAHADAWIVNILGGEYHTRAAWDARGGGWASSVTEDGWERFSEHLREARNCLTAAQTLHPEFPEAAAEMITVAMGDTRDGETPRQWFDLATRAQFDYAPAYGNLFWSLRPRWGGSHEEMYALGLECMQTKRYDTDVPHKMIQALEGIRDDMQDWSFWRRPGVFEQARDVLEQYDVKNPGPARAAYHESWIAGIAWQLNRWDDGRKALDQIPAVDEPLKSKGWEQADVIPARTMSGLYALTGPHANPLRQAEDNARAGKHVDAARAYEMVAAELKNDDPSCVFVRGRAQEHRWMSELATGKWVDLLADDRLTGWYPEKGTWAPDGRGGINCTVAAAENMLICGMPIGTDFEYTGIVAFTDIIHRPNTGGFQPGAGLIFAYSAPDCFCFIGARPTQQRAVLARGGSTKWTRYYRSKLPFQDGANGVGVMMRGDRATIACAERLTWSDTPLWDFTNRTDNRIGIGVENAWTGTTAHFTRLRVRLLSPTERLTPTTKPHNLPGADPPDDKL